MYICRIVSTVDVNECTFCVNEQQKVYFVYHINTIALYWEEKPTSLMNVNK